VTAPRLLSIPETAAVIGRPYTTVRDWVRRDAMPVEVLHINGTAFTRAADVADFLRITRDEISDLLSGSVRETPAGDKPAGAQQTAA
jgi:hypothetical protein